MEIRPGQTVVPRGGGDPLLQVLQVPAVDADVLTVLLVDALDGRRLPLKKLCSGLCPISCRHNTACYHVQTAGGCPPG